MRNFVDMANDVSHPVSRHPGDYTLFELGNFDESTGQIVPHPTPISLGVAIEFKNSAV